MKSDKKCKSGEDAVTIRPKKPTIERFWTASVGYPAGGGAGATNGTKDCDGNAETDRPIRQSVNEGANGSLFLSILLTL